MIEAHDHLKSGPLDQSRQTLTDYLKNVCKLKPRLTIITNAMAKVNSDFGIRDKQKVFITKINQITTILPRITLNSNRPKSKQLKKGKKNSKL
jgi:hypothetical protein